MRSNQLAAWSEMARAVAHEIKNPLTPIQLSSDHLRRLLAARGSAAPEVEACLDAIDKQVVALRRIAAEFSTYAKLPDLERVPTDAAELVREVLAAYLPAPPPGVRIEERYEPAPQVVVDRRVLARAVINLVENALEALRPAGGVLRAEVAAGDGGDEVVVAISDTGPGIGDEARRHLFEPYFSTKTSGTGLGLGIVRRAAEAHGGRVEVKSQPGAGTTFRIHLPVPSAARPPSHSSHHHV
jgi:nitrogen fixation/metabolism regulation signal transduction histidine kinase